MHISEECIELGSTIEKDNGNKNNKKLPLLNLYK
jgi:hypothetical protein